MKKNLDASYMHHSYSSLAARVTASHALLHNKIDGSGRRGEAQRRQRHSGGRGEVISVSWKPACSTQLILGRQGYQ